MNMKCYNKRIKINKARKNQYKWKQIGMFSDRKCKNAAIIH